MKCKNPHCNNATFAPVVELDQNILIGVKCKSCGARYTMNDIEIKKSLKRLGWNSVIWTLKPM